MLSFKLNIGTFTIILVQLHIYKENQTIIGNHNIQHMV